MKKKHIPCNAEVQHFPTDARPGEETVIRVLCPW